MCRSRSIVDHESNKNTRKCSIAAEYHIRSHNHVSLKHFCKPIEITLNII